MNDKRPVKVKNLKIIDHMGTYYATFDGTKMWKIEKWLFKLLMMCDGKKTFDQISEELANIAGVSVEEIRVGLKPIFEELEKEGFVSIT